MNKYLFRFNGRDVLICASGTILNHDYVHRAELEKHFNTSFPLGATRFICNAISIEYERGSDLQVLVPERLPCIPECMIEIFEVHSEVFSDAIGSAPLYEVQMVPGVPHQILDNGGFSTLQSPGTEAQSLSMPDSFRVAPPSRPALGAPQLHPPAYYAAKLAIKSFRPHPAEFAKRALIYNKAEEILSKRFTAYECGSPRLFVVLPEESIVEEDTAMDNVDSVQQFRIHFICECGQDHTIYPTHVLNNNGSGYHIRRPKEFFTQFGPFLLVMLETLLLGMDVGRYHFQQQEFEDQNRLSGQMMEVLRYLERFYKKDYHDPLDWQSQFTDLKDYLFDVSSTDQTRIVDYLRTEDNFHFGSLLRTVDVKGKVKWVCQEHYRLISRMPETQSLQLTNLTATNGGIFDGGRGLVKAVLTSALDAKTLYSSIVEVAEVHELDLMLNWVTDIIDFGGVRDMVKQTTASVITLDLGCQVGSEFELDFKARYNPLLDIMRHLSVQSVHLKRINGFWSRCVVSVDMTFHNLRSVRIPWSGSDHRLQFKPFLERAGRVERLDVDFASWDWDEIMTMLNTVMRSRTAKHCLTEFTIWVNEHTVPLLRMTIPSGDNWNSFKEDQNETDFFRQHACNIHQLFFHPGSDLLDVIAQGTSQTSKLSLLYQNFKGLEEVDRHFTVQILAQSPIARLRGLYLANAFADSILSAIQWNYLTTLCVSIPDKDPTQSLQRLFDCLLPPLTGSSSKPILRRLAVYFFRELALENAEVLLQLLRMFPLEELAICAKADLSTWIGIVNAINFSQLEKIHFGSQSILDGQFQTLLEQIPATSQLMGMSCDGFGELSYADIDRMGAGRINLETQTFIRFTDRWFQ